MARRRVLVIEDDSAIRMGLVDALSYGGYSVLQADRGDTGLAKALHDSIDLVLLDLILPGRDGFEVLQELRVARPTLPIIVLTARGEESQRVRGLKQGADDYVVKPFALQELLARVEAVLRRSPERPSDVRELRLLGIRIDLDARRVLHESDGASEELSAREADLLRFLAIHAGRVVSRAELLSRVWGIDPKRVQTRTLDVHVARLREKLRDDSAAPRIIRTVRGKGYRLTTADSGA